MLKFAKTICKLLSILCLNIVLGGCQNGTNQNPSTAFFYGKPIPENLLKEYDRVVVEFENLKRETEITKSYLDKIFIYTSVGEAEPWRKDFTNISSDCFLSYNTEWKSYITNNACKDWHNYIIEERIKPAWDLGVRGFFLDTLDSYMALNLSREQQEYQRRGLINLIESIHKKYPGVKFILNRGFHILPNIKNKVVGIAVESLYLGWDQVNKRYYKVSSKDREWLLVQLNKIKKEFDLPIVVIDYANLDDKKMVYENVSKINSLGFTPWVTSPYLDAIGVGAIDVAPGL